MGAINGCVECRWCSLSRHRRGNGEIQMLDCYASEELASKMERDHLRNYSLDVYQVVQQCDRALPPTALNSLLVEGCDTVSILASFCLWLFVYLLLNVLSTFKKL